MTRQAARLFFSFVFIIAHFLPPCPVEFFGRAEIDLGISDNAIEYLSIIVCHVSNGKKPVDMVLGQFSVELAYGRAQKCGDNRIYPFKRKRNWLLLLQKRQDLVMQTLAIFGGDAKRPLDDVMHSHSDRLNHDLPLSRK